MSALPTERERERFEAHKLLHEGKTVKEVARRLKKTPRWVERQEERFEELGTFKDRPRSGQPPKFTETDRSRLIRNVKGKERRSTRKMAKQFQTTAHVHVGREKIRLELKGAGLYPHRKRKVPRLTDAQKLRRVTFAKKYRRLIGPPAPFGMKLSSSLSDLKISKTISSGMSVARTIGQELWPTLQNLSSEQPSPSMVRLGWFPTQGRSTPLSISQWWTKSLQI